MLSFLKDLFFVRKRFYMKDCCILAKKKIIHIFVRFLIMIKEFFVKVFLMDSIHTVCAYDYAHGTFKENSIVFLNISMRLEKKSRT